MDKDIDHRKRWMLQERQYNEYWDKSVDGLPLVKLPILVGTTNSKLPVDVCKVAAMVLEVNDGSWRNMLRIYRSLLVKELGDNVDKSIWVGTDLHVHVGQIRFTRKYYTSSGKTYSTWSSEFPHRDTGEIITVSMLDKYAGHDGDCDTFCAEDTCLKLLVHELEEHTTVAGVRVFDPHLCDVK